MKICYLYGDESNVRKCALQSFQNSAEEEDVQFSVPGVIFIT